MDGASETNCRLRPEAEVALLRKRPFNVLAQERPEAGVTYRHSRQVAPLGRRVSLQVHDCSLSSGTGLHEKRELEYSCDNGTVPH